MGLVDEIRQIEEELDREHQERVKEKFLTLFEILISDAKTLMETKSVREAELVSHGRLLLTFRDGNYFYPHGEKVTDLLQVAKVYQEDSKRLDYFGIGPISIQNALKTAMYDLKETVYKAVAMSL